MSATTQELFIEVLSLPVRDRAELVHRLLASLEQSIATPEIEEAWREEAFERCKANDEGKIEERNADDVFEEAYVRLR